MSKTNTGLVAYAKAQLGLPYWYGTYGQIADKALYDRKRAQYPKYYTASDFTSQYGKRVYDCVGLIKGYMWTSSPAGKPVYSSAQDKNVSGMIKACSKTGNIKTIPSVPGTLVFIGTRHVGIYDGAGGVYEARGHAYGVVHTRLNDRPWDAWGYLPWIAYETAKVNVSGYPVLRIGNTGEYVKKLQTILRDKGYRGGNLKKLEIDGIFGKNTLYAVKKFQSAAFKGNKKEVDGFVGPLTWDKLVN